MKKVYLLTALLAFSSSAFAHPCNPNDKDFDLDKCIQHERLPKPDERPPIDWDKIPSDPIPKPYDPFPDPRAPQDIPFVPGVGNQLGGL